jgi:hypothetical protein
VAGGGADVRNLTAAQVAQIQAVADRYQITITLVGSRAAGTHTQASDFDYLIVANSRISRIRQSAMHLLPRGPRIGSGPGIEVFAKPLIPAEPHIVFTPASEPS